MSDLIWIGNTLYPRWFVFAVPTVMLVASVVAGWLLSWSISKLRRRS